MTPTPEQTAIVEAAAAGESLRVIALAGCAKSTTIRLAAAALPRNRRVCILAFNKKIKEEMEKQVPENVKVMTLNGLGHRAIQASSRSRLRLNPDKIYEVAKEIKCGEHTADVMALARAARVAGIVPQGSPGRGLLPDDPEQWAALADDLDIAHDLTDLARTLLRASNRRALLGEIDYDDQIYISTLILGSFPNFDTVFVDEAQDLSPLNHKQLRLCSKDQLIAVGDPHQAIYAWRGADHESMDNLLSIRPLRDLHLSTTFRCPKSIVERQREFVPLFTAADTNPTGRIQRCEEWAPEPGSAVLCRNNAPLISLAFCLLRHGQSVNYLGHDIGKQLKRIYKKLNPEGRRNRQEVIDLANVRLQTDEDKADRYLSLIAVLEAHTDIEGALEFLSTPKKNAVTLSTGHRAKGLEWPNVYHLNSGLIPSRHAVARGGAALQQEYNLRYVIETRTKDSLSFASLDNYEPHSRRATPGPATKAQPAAEGAV